MIQPNQKLEPRIALADTDEANLQRIRETAAEGRIETASVWTFNVSNYGEGCQCNFDGLGICKWRNDLEIGASAS